MSISALFVGALLAPACTPGNSLPTFTEGVRRAEKVVLHEGLPHKFYEEWLQYVEFRIKDCQELHGYPFYEELLELDEKDAKRLSEVLGDSDTYEPFSGEKNCVGFHPDYAVVWHSGEDRFSALISFGCGEVKLFGPRMRSRYDLNRTAFERLKKLLDKYQKNRPERQHEESLQTFTEAVRRAENLVLYEGLPHQVCEKELLEEELRTKEIQKLHGYPFYQELLVLHKLDAECLSKILGYSEAYEPFSGEKKCGDFHPDYAVEWHFEENRFRALICFGCGELKLFGPGLDSRYDLNRAAAKSLKELLDKYRKNRPATQDRR